MNRTNLKLIETSGRKVLVRNSPNYYEHAVLLSKLINNMYKLRNALIRNIDMFDEYREYIILLQKNFNQNRTKIYENTPYSNYTSYSVNKGEEFVFCLKCKKEKKLHSLNLLTYVAVHEMSHAACPEIGHTPLFNKIFRFFIQQAIYLKIYIYEDYNTNPVYYCGMKLYSNILNH